MDRAILSSTIPLKRFPHHQRQRVPHIWDSLLLSPPLPSPFCIFFLCPITLPSPPLPRRLQNSCPTSNYEVWGAL